MKVEQLHDLLSERVLELNADAEILVEGEDGILYDFSIEETEEAFDGFDTFYPAGLKIVPKRQ